MIIVFKRMFNESLKTCYHFKQIGSQRSVVGIIRFEYFEILLLQHNESENCLASTSELRHYPSCEAPGRWTETSQFL